MKEERAGCRMPCGELIIIVLLFIIMVQLCSCTKEEYCKCTNDTVKITTDSILSIPDVARHLGQYKDIDNNWYHSVNIGNQTWMVENLQTTHLNNGTPIDQIIIDKEWIDLATPVYCWYYNISNKTGQNGLLYNWYTVNTNKVCPINWHVATDKDWLILESFLGIPNKILNLIGWRGNDTITQEIKKAGYWDDYYEVIPNYNLEILPTGFRDAMIGLFNDFDQSAYLWTSTSYDNTTAYIRSLSTYNTGIFRGVSNKLGGMSVRCVKN